MIALIIKPELWQTSDRWGRTDPKSWYVRTDRFWISPDLWKRIEKFQEPIQKGLNSEEYEKEVKRRMAEMGERHTLVQFNAHITPHKLDNNLVRQIAVLGDPRIRKQRWYDNVVIGAYSVVAWWRNL